MHSTSQLRIYISYGCSQNPFQLHACTQTDHVATMQIPHYLTCTVEVDPVNHP